MFAAQLQILLYVCLLYNSSLHICACILLDPHQEDHERRECINMESNDQESCFYCAHNLHFHFCLVCGWTNCLPFISHQQKSGETFIHDTWNPIWISFLALLSSHHQLHCPASMWEMCMIYSKSMRLLPQIEKSRINVFLQLQVKSWNITRTLQIEFLQLQVNVFLLVMPEILFIIVLAVYLWKLQKSIWWTCQPIQQRGYKELHGGILHQYPSI